MQTLNHTQAQPYADVDPDPNNHLFLLGLIWRACIIGSTSAIAIIWQRTIPRGYVQPRQCRYRQCRYRQFRYRHW